MTSASQLKISIKTNINQVLREYKDIRNKDLPKQYGFALNDTARSLMRILNARTSKYFNRPVPAFTKQSFGYVRSTSKQKTINQKKAWVGVKGSQGVPASSPGPKDTVQFSQAAADRAKDLFELEIYGGTRYAKRGDLVKPSAHTREAGGMTAAGGLDQRTWLKTLSDDNIYFRGIPRGGAQGDHYKGIWERYADNTRIRMVAKLSRTASYRPLYPYDDIIKANYGPIINKNWRKQLQFKRREMARLKHR